MSVAGEAERFVIEEARLLDERRFEDWLSLFAADGFYWLPAKPDQADPVNHISVIYEDVSVLRMRVRRLSHHRAYAALPLPHTAHMIGSITAEAASGLDADVLCRSTVIVAEYHSPDRRLWAGRQLHKLRRTPDGLRIVLKRIDLIDAEGALGIISVPI